ncbi:MAG: hypothetical protein ACE5DX_02860 [Candidatus Dojkabacteria bacterium]
MKKTISINPGKPKEFVWTLLLKPKTFVSNYLPFSSKSFAVVLFISMILVVLLYGFSDYILLSETNSFELSDTILFSLQAFVILTFIAFVLITAYYLGLKIFKIKLPFRYILASMLFISLVGFILDKLFFVLLLLIGRIPDSTQVVNTVLLNDLVIIFFGAWQAIYMVAVVKSKAKITEQIETVILLSYLMLTLMALRP